MNRIYMIYSQAKTSSKIFSVFSLVSNRQAEREVNFFSLLSIAGVVLVLLCIITISCIMLGKVYIEDIEALVNEGYPDIPQNEEKFTINGVYEERALDSSYSIIYDALLRDYNNNKIEYTDLCTGLIAILKKTIILEPIFQDAMVWSPEVSHDSNSRIFVQKSRERDKCSVFLVTCGAGENKVTQILDGKYIQDIDLIANNLMKVVYGDEECVVEIKDFDTVLVTGVQFSRGVHDNNVLS